MDKSTKVQGCSSTCLAFDVLRFCQATHCSQHFSSGHESSQTEAVDACMCWARWQERPRSCIADVLFQIADEGSVQSGALRPDVCILLQRQLHSRRYRHVQADFLLRGYLQTSPAGPLAHHALYLLFWRLEKGVCRQLAGHLPAKQRDKVTCGSSEVTGLPKDCQTKAPLTGLRPPEHVRPYQHMVVDELISKKLAHQRCWEAWYVLPQQDVWL